MASSKLHLSARVVVRPALLNCQAADKHQWVLSLLLRWGLEAGRSHVARRHRTQWQTGCRVRSWGNMQSTTFLQIHGKYSIWQEHPPTNPSSEEKGSVHWIITVVLLRRYIWMEYRWWRPEPVQCSGFNAADSYGGATTHHLHQSYIKYQYLMHDCTNGPWN